MDESATILTSAATQAEDARQAGAESLNGNGFYRFNIGDFQATVISDGYGPIPVGPIFAMNDSEAELAPVLKANFRRSSRARPFWTASPPMGSWRWAIIFRSRLLDMSSDTARHITGKLSSGPGSERITSFRRPR